MIGFIRLHFVCHPDVPTLLNPATIFTVTATEDGRAYINGRTPFTCFETVEPFEWVATQLEEPRFVRLPCVCADGTLGALWARPESITCVDEEVTPDGHAAAALRVADSLERIHVALPVADVLALLGAKGAR